KRKNDNYAPGKEVNPNRKNDDRRRKRPRLDESFSLRAIDAPIILNRRYPPCSADYRVKPFRTGTSHVSPL
ncbi:hypothetical protein, partial [Pantoea ananatis]|uniref:hypothetical protein n=1 Tax=Pantoea ananas TaxID=553 RepID=UPI001B305D68